MLVIRVTARQTLRDTPGMVGFHDLRTRKMGDVIVVDVHLEVDDRLSIVDGHDIAAARRNVIDRHPVLNVTTHIDRVSRTVSGPPSMMPVAYHQS
ncbi:cation transporter dimerization domain-containing protein [Paraburkholderia kirstenboschensis]|uniref:cation transporter dimerization domain-containing protein n=1 Tax=Paraburkholderia kirstenboschensis TaxID=1245436 RepID=UPI002E2E3DEE|nr:cation transporter dimerization domain-containing protein [Paraburkholderia kirstenboschensis]